MRATNHAITGAIIAVIVDKPAIALPLAFLSHFAQDAVPHFGYAGHNGYAKDMKHKLAIFMMIIDPIIFVPLLIILTSHHVSVWVYCAAFLALSPDFHDFIAYFIFHKPKMFNRFSRYAQLIQWCERPWGLAVEAVWYVAGLIILVKLLA